MGKNNIKNLINTFNFETDIDISPIHKVENDNEGQKACALSKPTHKITKELKTIKSSTNGDDIKIITIPLTNNNIKKHSKINTEWDKENTKDNTNVDSMGESQRSLFQQYQHEMYKDKGNNMAIVPKEVEVKIEEKWNGLWDDDWDRTVNIKVLGVGGAGNNMVHHMAKTNALPKGVSLYAVNTDVQALKILEKIDNKVLIGRKLTRGFGSGSDPEIGKKAALEDIDGIKDHILKGTDLLFITAGMGKGTGTGASPEIAKIAREMGILTIAIVNLPSIKTEGEKMYKKALGGLENLAKNVDAITTISNDKIIAQTLQNEKLSCMEAYTKADQLIFESVGEISNMVLVPSKINVDFADVKTFFKTPGHFQTGYINLSDMSDLKPAIEKCFAETLYEESMYGSTKAIINYRMNETIPISILSDTKDIFKEMTQNDDIEIVHSLDYKSDIKCAELSFVISTNNHSNIETLNMDNKIVMGSKKSHYVSQKNDEKSKTTKNKNVNSAGADTNNFLNIEPDIGSYRNPTHAMDDVDVALDIDLKDKAIGNSTQLNDCISKTLKQATQQSNHNNLEISKRRFRGIMKKTN